MQHISKDSQLFHDIAAVVADKPQYKDLEHCILLNDYFTADLMCFHLGLNVIETDAVHKEHILPVNPKAFLCRRVLAEYITDMRIIDEIMFDELGIVQDSVDEWLRKFKQCKELL
jgi:hypothetical protein